MTATALDKPGWASWWPLVSGVGLYAFSKYLGEVTKMQEMFKELEEIRSSRDAAIATAGHAMTLVASCTAIEKLLREKLKAAEDRLKKDSDAYAELHRKHSGIVQDLEKSEKATKEWQRKHADIEARCAQLEATLKEKKKRGAKA